ncbi:hypothetical protein [Streptomyces sp. NBC_00454]|uniref:hypothetical protein n=1 Tax=Streptomyces sp. NBC_00454 TaxID=2975747 RepID=UPI003249022A
MSGTSDTSNTSVSGEATEPAEPAAPAAPADPAPPQQPAQTRSRTATRLKWLAVVAVGVGVVVAGSLLAPEARPAAPRGNWVKVDASAQQSVYSGPEPTQAMVWEDFDVVTADAGVGPDVDGGNPMLEAWGDCAAGYRSFEFVSDSQLTGLVNGLVARGWTMDARLTEPVLGYSLFKGGWRLDAYAKGPRNANHFSLLALKGTPECEKRIKEHKR